MIEDALLINPHIKSVEDVVVNKDLDKLNITCTINTKYGDVYVKNKSDNVPFIVSWSHSFLIFNW